MFMHEKNKTDEQLTVTFTGGRLQYLRELQHTLGLCPEDTLMEALTIATSITRLMRESKLIYERPDGKLRRLISFNKPRFD